jgi:hypothetical protein
VAIEEMVAGQVFPGRRRSLRARSASPVFARSGTASEDKDAGHGPNTARASDMPSKSVGGRKLAGGFDSRPPPLLKASSVPEGDGAEVVLSLGRHQALPAPCAQTEPDDDPDPLDVHITLYRERKPVRSGRFF